MGAHYFISYSSVDAEQFAAELSDRLAKRGIPVWLDKNEMRSGVDWDEQIAQALRTCQGLLFLMIQLGQMAKACEQYQDAIHIADETGNKQNQHEAHFGLAWALLLTGGLTAAREAIETARRHDYPSNNAAMWTLMGIIQLRQAERAAAREAFSRGLAEANGLLKKFDKNLLALDTKALALCGLALCEDERHRELAAEALHDARKITKAKGIVARVLTKFDALAQADTDGVLAPLRNVVSGN